MASIHMSNESEIVELEEQVKKLADRNSFVMELYNVETSRLEKEYNGVIQWRQ